MTIKDCMERLKTNFELKTQGKYEVFIEHLKISKVYVLTIVVRKYNRCGFVKYAMGSKLFNEIKSRYKVEAFMYQKTQDLIDKVINKEFELETRFGQIPTEVDKWTECREEDREEMEALYRK